jgi:hypothetical protein
MIQVRKQLCDWFANLLRFVSLRAAAKRPPFTACERKQEKRPAWTSNGRGPILLSSSMAGACDWLNAAGWLPRLEKNHFSLGTTQRSLFFCGAQKEKHPLFASLLVKQ